MEREWGREHESGEDYGERKRGFRELERHGERSNIMGREIVV